MRNTNQLVPIVEYEYLKSNDLNWEDYLTEHEVKNNFTYRKLYYTQHTEYPEIHIEAIAALDYQAER